MNNPFDSSSFTLRAIDCSAQLRTLRVKPGVKEWLVISRAKKECEDACAISEPLILVAAYFGPVRANAYDGRFWK